MFVTRRGFRISYQVFGTGPDLVLIHGLYMWGSRWHDTGYVDALAGKFRLIVPDMIGHGESEKPQDPAAYGPVNMAADVLAILDAEGIGQAHVWGYSMGANVSETLAVTAPDRVRSLTLGGFPPGLSREQLDAFEWEIPDSWEEWDDGSFPPAVVAMFRDHNPDFRPIRACMQAIWSRPAVSLAGLRALAGPILTYIGADDYMADLAREQCAALPCRLEIVPGGHVEAFREIDNVLPFALSHLDAAATAASA